MKVLKNRDYIENGMLSASEKHFSGECDCHAHEFFEMELILDGSGVYEIDGDEYEASRGTLFLLNPSRVHAVRAADMHLINLMFVLTGDEPSEAAAWFLNAPPLLLLSADDADFLRTLFSEIVKAEALAPQYAAELLQCVMMKVSALSGGNGGDKRLSRYIRDALFLLHKDFCREVSLLATAEKVGLSPAYFSDLFRRETGVSFKAYLDNLRLSYAAKLISHTALSVKEVCFRAGFSDYANFSKRFKGRYGASATDFRKGYQKAHKCK